MTKDDVLNEKLGYLGGTAFGQSLCFGVAREVVSSYDDPFISGSRRWEWP